MLSELRRHRIVDRRGTRAQLIDLAVDLSAGDYPPVTRIFFTGSRGNQMELPWEAVISSDWRLSRLRVTDLHTGRAAPMDALRRTVLLRRDILDALLIDVAHRQTMRANDLWLGEDNGQLWLRAADISPWAVLRRLGRGLLGGGAGRRLVDWRDVEFLRGDPRTALENGDYHRRIARLSPPAIARLAEDVPYHHAAELLTLLPDPVAADTLEAMSPERQLQVFEDLDEKQAVRLLALMAPDRAADLVGHLEEASAKRCLEHLPAPNAERIIDLLRYPEDTAGGIMTNDIPVASAWLTVKQARSELRDHIAAPDFVYYIYVVEDAAQRILCGVITLRDLLVKDDCCVLGEVMRRDVVSIDPLQPAVEAARRVVEEHLAALPVVARDGRLLGAITVEAAVAMLTPASWREYVPRVFS
ncbi:MAG: magnesium transporter MgtE N-terminal domain-containing protein [Solirubrobacteraceae bacterium]